jgi:uncharacterized protein YjbI with pentapeptide repeats
MFKAPRESGAFLFFIPFQNRYFTTMGNYTLDVEFNQITYSADALNLKEFERCVFRNCDFSVCNFIGVTFIDCVFFQCNFTGAKINHVALRTVRFEDCEIKDVNFSMCDKLIFDIAFTDCILDFSKFYTLKIKGTAFTNCSLIAVDFMNTDLTEVVFDHCDLYRSEFNKAIANKTDFRTSYNYTIDPEKTKIKKAVFSFPEVKGLLFKHDLLIK